MSYQNGTTHYNLPLTVSSDKRDWADTNQAFTDVDAALHGAVADVATAGATATEALTKVNAADADIAQIQSDIATLQASDTTQDTTLLQHGQRITALEPRTVHDITCDGVKTVGALLNEMYPFLNALTEAELRRVHLLVGTFRMPLMTIDELGNFHFNETLVPNGQNTLLINDYTIRATGSIRTLVTIADGVAPVISDASSVVPPAGMKYELYLV